MSSCSSNIPDIERVIENSSDPIGLLKNDSSGTLIDHKKQSSTFLPQALLDNSSYIRCHSDTDWSTSGNTSQNAVIPENVAGGTPPPPSSNSFTAFPELNSHEIPRDFLKRSTDPSCLLHRDTSTAHSAFCSCENGALFQSIAVNPVVSSITDGGNQADLRYIPPMTGHSLTTEYNIYNESLSSQSLPLSEIVLDLDSIYSPLTEESKSNSIGASQTKILKRSQDNSIFNLQNDDELAIKIEPIAQNTVSISSVIPSLTTKVAPPKPAPTIYQYAGGKNRKFKFDMFRIEDITSSKGNNNLPGIYADKNTRKRKLETSKNKEKSLHKDPEYIKDYSSEYPKFKSKVILPLMTNEREGKILRMSRQKAMSIKDVQQVLWLFKLRNFDLKLKFLVSIIGRPSKQKLPPHEKDNGLIITERTDKYLSMTIKTYAGADDSAETFDGSIVSCFKDVKQFQIYFRQPNQPTTYKSKNNLLKNATKKRKLEKGLIPIKCVKRPLNSFMLYRALMVKAIILLSFMDSLSDFLFEKTGLNYKTYDPEKEKVFLENSEIAVTEELKQQLKSQFKVKKFNHHLLIQIVSLMWANEDPTIKEEFYRVAGIEKKIHTLCYPEYKYRPNRKN